MSFDQLSARMRDDWDARARENAKFYIVDSNHNWTEEDFYASGHRTVAEEILTDMENICQDKAPAEMRVLEIGCGAGRVTSALAGLFGEVDAVDISPEMVALARRACAAKPNVRIHNNNGVDLAVLPGAELFDFAFSVCVFHHVPSREVIENYVREVGRLLRPGALFKFEVQGDPRVVSAPLDTWLGVPFIPEQATAMAERSGFEPRYSAGAGQERFWHWFFKR
ncbi:MAG: class I SAM-dependent methyltransferase [Bryobacterales bacterium]|nr:class I SAM-dependent methyltransferase [Bryobacterales bacterium]